jgi:hypothetical protein
LTKELPLLETFRQGIGLPFLEAAYSFFANKLKFASFGTARFPLLRSRNFRVSTKWVP